MKGLLGTTTVVVCGVLLVSAWSTAADAQKKGKKSSGGGAVTVSGCLQKGNEANTYMLTNVSGGGPYELIGAPAGVNLAPHVGHRIEVTGKNVANPKKAAKIEGKKGAEKKEERGEHHLQVQSFKMVSPSCP
jgi:hypothetical protein